MPGSQIIEFTQHSTKFDEAEFYPPGPVLTVQNGTRKITVVRTGESHFTLADEVTTYRTEDHALLREAYPGGVLPEDRVELNNGWFELYEAGQVLDDSVAHSLAEALADAQARAEIQRTGADALDAAMLKVSQAARGDSNDAEIEALGEALDQALRLVPITRALHDALQVLRGPGPVGTGLNSDAVAEATTELGEAMNGDWASTETCARIAIEAYLGAADDKMARKQADSAIAAYDTKFPAGLLPDVQPSDVL